MTASLFFAAGAPEHPRPSNVLPVPGLVYGRPANALRVSPGLDVVAAAELARLREFASGAEVAR